MFKKIRIVTIFITILLSIMIIIGIMFVLDGVGIIDLGEVIVLVIHQQVLQMRK